MKRLPALILAACIFSGCEKPDILKSDAEKATPTPAPATPVPTPKPGAWMLKDYKNPLDGGKRPANEPVGGKRK